MRMARFKFLVYWKRLKFGQNIARIIISYLCFQPKKQMKLNYFVRNLRVIGNGHDLDHKMLTGLYERIQSQKFQPGKFHTTQVCTFMT